VGAFHVRLRVGSDEGGRHRARVKERQTFDAMTHRDRSIYRCGGSLEPAASIEPRKVALWTVEMTGRGHVVLRLDRLVPIVDIAETCYRRAKVEPPGGIGTDHVITDDVELPRVSGVGTEDVTITGDVVARVYRFYITLHGLAPIATDDTGARVLSCLTGSAHLSPVNEMGGRRAAVH
jgi:hypothetical protein